MADFLDFLKDHRKGELIDELTAALREVTEGVLEHDKKGSITLKIEVAPLDGGWAAFVSDDLKSKVPEADREGNIMFPDGQNNLHRKDQNQISMADAPAEDEVRVVDGENVVNMRTGEVV
jgi:hypothetical protein